MISVSCLVTLRKTGIDRLFQTMLALRDNVAVRILIRAKQTCPVDTGALRDSGTWHSYTNAAQVIFGESNAVAARTHRISYLQRPRSRVTGAARGPEFYALWVEKGGRFRPGRWFLTRALLFVFTQPLPKESDLTIRTESGMVE